MKRLTVQGPRTDTLAYLATVTAKTYYAPGVNFITLFGINLLALFCELYLFITITNVVYIYKIVKLTKQCE